MIVAKDAEDKDITITSVNFLASTGYTEIYLSTGEMITDRYTPSIAAAIDGYRTLQEAVERIRIWRNRPTGLSWSERASILLEEISQAKRPKTETKVKRKRTKKSTPVEQDRWDII